MLSEVFLEGSSLSYVILHNVTLWTASFTKWRAPISSQYNFPVRISTPFVETFIPTALFLCELFNCEKTLWSNASQLVIVESRHCSTLLLYGRTSDVVDITKRPLNFSCRVNLHLVTTRDYPMVAHDRCWLWFNVAPTPYAQWVWTSIYIVVW